MRHGLSCSQAGKLGYIASRETQKAMHDAVLQKYEQNPTLCAQCGKVLDYKHRSNKFCSQSCAATYNNTARVKQRYKTCINCGKQIAYNNTYCNPACQNEYRWKQYKKTAKQTGVFPACAHNQARRPLVRRFLLQEYGHKCAICGIRTWRGQPAPLVVDHIDGDATNSKIQNFRLICGNCDMQTPTYKGRNKRGRLYRRQRYAQGKSY